MPSVTGDRSSLLVQRAALASVALALGLVLLKLTAALVTGSIAVLSSLVDSLADVVASAITWASVRVSRQPPDRAHRFGHGKAEALSAFAQSTLVLASALFVVTAAAQRAIDPRPVRAEAAGIAVMLAAMVLTGLLLAFQWHVVRRTGSQAIAADSLHYRADLATNLAVLVSLVVASRFGLPWLDGLTGIAIAFWLATGAARIGRQAIDTLMDRELPDPLRSKIEATVRAHPEVVDLHDLRTRRSGGTVFIEMHLELPPTMTVREAHAVCEAVEDELRALFPGAEIVLHQEPAGIADLRLDDRIRRPAGPASQ